MLDIEFGWTVREHARAQHVILVKRFFTEGKSLFLFVPLGLVLLGTGVAAWLAIQGDATYLGIALPVVLVLAIAAWVIFWGRGWVNGWHQRRTDSSLQYPIHHLLSEHGLRVRGRSAEVTLGWRSMIAVMETPEFMLFYYSGSSAYYLPKRVVSAEQLDELRALIRANARRPSLLS